MADTQMSKIIKLKITKRSDDTHFNNILTKSKQIMEYNDKKMISDKHIKLAIKELFNNMEAKKYIDQCKTILYKFEDDNKKPENFTSIKKKIKKICNSRIYEKTVVFCSGL
jgi:hypothetical protein